MKKMLRAPLLSFTKDPADGGEIRECCVYYEDGLLVISDGRIDAVGDYARMIESLQLDPALVDTRYRHALIMPGFIDTHVHYPQTEIIGSFGEQLLAWLETYTFPAEMKFGDPSYADAIAAFFIEELFRNGTTTAMAYATVHPNACDALFRQADRYNMRLLAGKVLMDRNAPEALRDTAQTGYDESLALIRKWHGHHRLLYTITPRFAPTSTPEQLEGAGALKAQHPDTYVQTHLSENLDEIAWVKSLFPEAKSYLDVYDRFGLVTDRSVFGHAIHLEPSEYALLQEKRAAVSLCPTSNLFLGSGLFKLRRLKAHRIPIGFGSDVGAGTTFNMLKTLNEAYKIVSLEQNRHPDRKALGAFEAFYQATLGAAVSLRLEEKIGKLQPGYEADFIVIDFAASALQRLRMQKIEDEHSDPLTVLAAKLFALMMMGDDRNIEATFVNGEQVYAGAQRADS